MIQIAQAIFRKMNPVTTEDKGMALCYIAIAAGLILGLITLIAS